MDTALTSRRIELDDPAEAMEFFYQQGWTDGLPVVPPTPKRVEEFLEYAGNLPGDILGMIPARNRVITAEKVAINAVMAGCLPNYMPVIVAAIEAMCQEEFNLHGISATTGGTAPLLIVNGPAVQQLNINYGVNCFGPGVRANATIGRAIRLILMNVGGSIPGVLDKSCLGHPGKYSYCIAEDEEARRYKRGDGLRRRGSPFCQQPGGWNRRTAGGVDCQRVDGVNVSWRQLGGGALPRACDDL